MTRTFLIAVIYDILVALLGGWMFSYLWLWFVVPTFGLSPITVIQAVGLVITVGFLVKRGSSSKDSDTIEDVVTSMFLNIISMFVIFGFGFIFSFFM